MNIKILKYLMDENTLFPKANRTTHACAKLLVVAAITLSLGE
jgi:hypothetical protein